MSPKIRQVFFFVVLLAIPIASFFLVFKPQNAEIERAKQEIEHKQAMLEKLREATAQTADLERANDEIRKSIEKIEARLPSGKEMDDVLRQVSSLASRSGLKLPQFKKSDKPLPAGLAFEQSLEVKMTGDFDGFYRFLLELEKLPRITRIPNLKIIRDDSLNGNMRAEFVLSIFYQSQGAGQ